MVRVEGTSAGNGLTPTATFLGSALRHAEVMLRFIGLEGKPLGAAHVLDMVPLPADSPYGNLGLKGLHIVNRLVHANSRLDDVETTWRALIGPFDAAAAADGIRHRFCVDEVVVHLRRAADELIGLLWVLQERANQGSWPRQRLVDSIGSAQAKGGGWRLEILRSHEWLLLLTLNDVANAHMHSFVDSDFQAVGLREPCVVALGLRQNKIENGATPYVVPLDSMIAAFNTFYTDVMAGWRAA